VASPSATLLELNLFGVPHANIGKERLRLSLKRSYSLLAYLALEQRPVPREHIVSLLWPGTDATVGRTRLRRLIYETEYTSGCELFDTCEGSIALSPGAVRCDAAEFRRMARGVIAGAATGDPDADVEALALAACTVLMDGLHCDSQEFDDWVRTQRVEHEHLLCRLLVRLADRQHAQGNHDAAIDTVERLLRLDPYSERAYVLRMAIAADLGDDAGVEAAFTRCAETLRAEFGTKPAATTERAYAGHRARSASARIPGEPGDELGLAPETRFAFGKAGAVAYAIVGHGSEALVLLPGFVSHMEIAWEHPGIRRVIGQLAMHFNVVIFDRRGVGLSERLGAVSTTESAVADVLAVLDAASIGKAWLFGSSEGGPAAIQLAAQHPARVSGLVLFGAMSRGSRATDYPWALQRESFDVWMRNLVAGWGGPADLETFAPALRRDPWTRSWWARMLRHAASPASLRAVLAGLRDADVRSLLPSVDCPTLVMHRRGDRAVRFEAGEYLAANIRHAEFVPMDGECHWWWVEDADAVAAEILRFAKRRPVYDEPRHLPAAPGLTN
jgi:pimeloyl-ACP methyl ester carboxylesterase/DNA-binding SARP family transcriptional activator